jgi:hypothetical protein
MLILISGAILLSLPLRAECIPFSEAAQHVGETKSVKGKILRVEQGSTGTTFSTSARTTRCVRSP